MNQHIREFQQFSSFEGKKKKKNVAYISQVLYIVDLAGQPDGQDDQEFTIIHVRLPCNK